MVTVLWRLFPRPFYVNALSSTVVTFVSRSGYRKRGKAADAGGRLTQGITGWIVLTP